MNTPTTSLPTVATGTGPAGPTATLGDRVRRRTRVTGGRPLPNSAASSGS